MVAHEKKKPIKSLIDFALLLLDLRVKSDYTNLVFRDLFFLHVGIMHIEYQL